jgi:hypothetical protein
LPEWTWLTWIALVAILGAAYNFLRVRRRFGINVGYFSGLVVSVLLWLELAFGWPPKREPFLIMYLLYLSSFVFFVIGYLTCWWLLGKPERRHIR